MVILIAVAAILLTIIIALILAAAVKGLDTAVIQSNAAAEIENRAYNPALTFGYQIPVEGDADVQYREARRQAAKQAAATPRGANLRIGPQYKKERLHTAIDGVPDDPITAVKIAAVHGWDAARTGVVYADLAPAVAAPAAAPAAGGAVELVPGKDYPVINITDDMPADEVRKARIANAKAKSAAMKAAKTAPVSAGAPVAAVVGAPPAAGAAPTPAAVAGIPKPTLIEVTDDMSPEEKRNARIANAKANSAYNKALKAAGIDPKSVAA